MGFSVVSANPHLVWMPVEPSQKVYMGAIVSVDSATPLEGVQPLPQAAGAGNTTNKDVPLGVVVGLNSTAANRVSDSGGEYITQVAAGAVYGSTTEYVNVEGEWAKGDRQAFVQVALIDPSTIIRGPIYNGSVGTPPTEVTVTTGCGGDGIGCTTGSADATTIANFATIYMRSGQNRGIYRTLTSNSATTHTWLKAMPGTINVGDKAVVINGLRPYGPALMQLDSNAIFVDCSAALSSDYFQVIVTRLHLSVAGNEFVEFKFSGDNFDIKRA